MDAPRDEAELSGLALGLGAATVGRLSPAERALASGATRASAERVKPWVEQIRSGEDPLGDAFSVLRSPAERRASGAVYTPEPIVRAMTAWATEHEADTVVDPGSGSGRFLLAAGRALPKAALIAVETDPLATLLLRANLAVAGLGGRARVLTEDFRRVALPARRGRTLFLGNPPYVRHHALPLPDKRWFTEAARGLSLRASALAGLHAHFFLRTAELARPGDVGVFVTAAEWLDVNYGALVRELFLERLGGVALHVVEPRARPFANADTTAVISCFEVGARPERVRLQRVASSSALGTLRGGRALPRERFEASARWSTLTARSVARPAGFVELGELCAVHRGQVTGSNAAWIAPAQAGGLPEHVCFPAVTRARELFAAGSALTELAGLRRVIDLPADLDELGARDRERVEAFLREVRKRGVHRGFIAQHRKAWWAVGLRAPAPILATYMARRPPAFVRNLAGARHINIAHGLYPREPLAGPVLDALAAHLQGHTALSSGRTYAGGLTKFEPREMQRLLVPGLELLRAM